tara:strand:+ start:90 stop:236 length:147 start_codon:yes stop_codon:yes gene_type:complete
MPVINRRKAISLFFLLECFQSARQNMDTPSIQKENGMGFPENSISRPE